MKSIANQYRDLKEGRMSQANFMRNLRMMMPQHVTNVTSFNDAIKILKNKAILTEVSDSRSKMSIENDLKNLLSKGYSYSEAIELIAAEEGVDASELEAMFPQDMIDVEGYEEDEGEIEDLIKKMEMEKAGEEAVMGQYDPMEEELNEAKKKKEAKAELHPNKIHPQELRMGIKVELEHTDDLDKAKKIALDHLAENPFYYTALKLSGIESPSAPKAKAPVEKKAKKRETKPELVDKDNQMTKVKTDKKKLKEANYNIEGEPNAAAKQAMQFVDGNSTLRALSDDIEIQQSFDDAILRYRYWKALPGNAVEKLKLQFDVEVMDDYDEDTGPIIAYRLTPLRKSGNKDLGASFDKLKSQLEEIVREVLSEMQSDEQETDNIAMTMGETFDGRDNLVDDIASQLDEKMGSEDIDGWIRSYIEDAVNNQQLDLDYRSEFDEAFNYAIDTFKKEHGFDPSSQINKDNLWHSL